jgi:hypothetical protein
LSHGNAPSSLKILRVITVVNGKMTRIKFNIAL